MTLFTCNEVFYLNDESIPALCENRGAFLRNNLTIKIYNKTMNDWNIIWNGFCDEVAVSVKKNNLEKVFEENIVKDFFGSLNWNRLNLSLREQFPIHVAHATLRADFALFIPGKEKPEFIVELKRPKKQKSEDDAKQLIDYMTAKECQCSFGILLLGDKMEIYYIDYSTANHEAALIETIRYQHDNDAARQLMEVLQRDNYSLHQMLEYCQKRHKINKSIEYWCSSQGKTEIMSMIIERSKLPEPLLETLRSTLVVDVHRRDGLAPIVHHKEEYAPSTAPALKPQKPAKGGAREPKVWMISASSKFFDHRKCFREQGFIYWKQYNNLQPGDTGYIYFSKPEQAVFLKFEILECNLPFSDEMLAEKKYYKKEQDFEDAAKHNRFYKIRLLQESAKGVSLTAMMQHGLKQAPLSALNLSDNMFSELLNYIEENF